MSRTYKDRPNRIKWGRWDDDIYFEDCEVERRDYYTGELVTREVSYMLHYAGYHPKKKRDVNTEWKWMRSTPSWYTRLMMNKPKRRQCRLWEHSLHTVVDLEEADCPDYGRKPHIYYW